MYFQEVKRHTQGGAWTFSEVGKGHADCAKFLKGNLLFLMNYISCYVYR
jgi:hypothetical protein